MFITINLEGGFTMRQNKFSIFMFIVIALAIFGVIFSLINNPKEFLFSILKVVGIAIVLSSIAYFIIIKKRGPTKDTSEMKKYKQALKQSKLKYSDPKKEMNKSKTTPLKRNTMKPKKRPSHLKVIEGNKTDKKSER